MMIDIGIILALISLFLLLASWIMRREDKREADNEESWQDVEAFKKVRGGKQ